MKGLNMPVEIKDINIDQFRTEGNNTYAYWKGKLVAIVQYDSLRDVLISKEISKK